MAKRNFGTALVLLFLSGCLIIACRYGKSNVRLKEKEALGKEIFFDATLSHPVGQSCATCHRPERSFTDTLGRPTSEGAHKGIFGKRNALALPYSGYTPVLHYNADDETYVGGMFWDGRADSLSHQAGMPFLDIVEMANSDTAMVVTKIKSAPYYKKLLALYAGWDASLYTTKGIIDSNKFIYACVTNALAAYQMSPEINPFSSKFDLFLEGKYNMTPQEENGYKIFMEKGLCAECHVLTPDPAAQRILFTDHTYDNLGIPRKEDNKYFGNPKEYNPLGADYQDLGLGFTTDSTENGKFRVPTLRNIAKTAPYGHNGYFSTLKEIINFYNIRDISDRFPPAEYPENVNKEELGNLGLTEQEENDLVVFLHLLTDI